MVELVWSEINLSRTSKMEQTNKSSKEIILDIFSKKDLLEQWKYSKIKWLPDTEESKTMNKDMITEIWKAEEWTMRKIYEGNDIDDKYLTYAQTYIHKKLKKDGVTNKDICKIMQLIKGERFLIMTNKNNEWEDRYVQFEIKDNKRQKYWAQGEKIIGRHIDDGVNIKHMADYLLEGKKEIIDKIPAYKDIKYIHSCTWLGDKNFIKRWEKERKGKPSRIIDLFNQEKNYSKYLGTQEREIWFWKKRRFANQEDKLWPVIEKYIQDTQNNMWEGERLINLEKMEKRQKRHMEKQRS